jgi:hypothetical protein
VEGVEYDLSNLQVSGVRGDEEDDVVSVQRCPKRDCIDTKWVEERPLIGLADHGVQHLHDKEEEQGGKRFPLVQAPRVTDHVAHRSVEEDLRGSRLQHHRDPL